MSNLLNVEIICKCIVHLKSNKRIVLPHIFFLENDSDFTERRIENWYKQLSKEDKNRYATIIEDNVMGNFLTEYAHNNDVNKLDKIIMLTRGGVKSLIGYIYKKGKNDAAKAAECMDSFNNAFSHVEQSKMQHNVFDDKEYEDQQYEIRDMALNVHVNNSPGAVVNTTYGDENSVSIGNRTNKTGFKKRFRWISIAVAIVLLLIFCYVVYNDFQQTHDWQLTLKNLGWTEWIIALLDLCLGIVTIFSYN